MKTFTVLNRWRKLGKSDFAVSANVAYGEVKLEALGDVDGEYEEPDKLTRSGQAGEGNYEPTADVQLPMNPLLVNQRLHCMLQQMKPLAVEKQHNDDLKLMLTWNYYTVSVCVTIIIVITSLVYYYKVCNVMLVSLYDRVCIDIS